MMRIIGVVIVLVGLLGAVSIQGARFDPTQPPFYQDTSAKTIRRQDLIISAILISHDRKVAIVNGNVIHVGDTILGLQVLDIEKNAVKFHSTEGFFSIPLHTDVKQQGSSKEKKV